jgi:hypothetical protein
VAVAERVVEIYVRRMLIDPCVRLDRGLSPNPPDGIPVAYLNGKGTRHDVARMPVLL